MAQTAVFDTLAAVQRLEDAGVERKHAEAYAEAIATAVHPMWDQEGHGVRLGGNQEGRGFRLERWNRTD